MATKNRKSRILLAAATVAMAMTGMSSPSFAQRDDRGPREGRPAPQMPQMQRGEAMNQMRQQQREQFRQQRMDQPRQMPQRPAPAQGERPSWGGRQDAPQGRPAWSGGEQRQVERQGWQQRDGDRARNPMWRGDNPAARPPAPQPDRRVEDARRDAAQRWRDNDRRGDNGQWRGDGRRWDNNGWRDNDRRGDNDRWRNDGRRWDNNGWRGNDRGDRYQSWNRSDWRRDNRYDWQRYRDRNRNVYRIGRYYAPYSNYSYRRLSIGISLGSMFYGDRYWINDPWSYRLPPVYGPYRWVRYYDDVVLVDVYTGQVMDVIYDFFW